MNIWKYLLDILFPPKCPFCGCVLDHPGICDACQTALPWIDDADALRELPGGARCAAPLWYRDLARKGLLRFKFQGGSAAADPLGALIVQCAAEHLSGEFDTLSWVPVSRRRLRERGYDQAQLLAQAAGRVWGVRPERLLEKVRDNPAQSGLEGAEARQENVRNVYQALPAAAGKRILLIDDICTTGATLSECARVLTQAGAAGVVCAAAARTPREKVHSSVKE